ncbi:MAG: VCBS repeat-containing protein [Acidobacteria bacterium]|nr:VCBS repeat-containing protein [Acidobacteriota bacterium]
MANVPFGLSGDDPTVVGDYDGDGKADLAVFRPVANPPDTTPGAEFWFEPLAGPNANKQFLVPWGIASDFPVPGDYNGDGKADFAVARDNGGAITIWVKYGDGTATPNAGGQTDRWGLDTDYYVPGDYDGDGKTDDAIVRDNGTNLEWWVRWSSDGSIHRTVWGVSGDLTNAVQGDYDGDGKTDVAIWRRSDATFYVISSQTGTPIYRTWGVAGSTGDVPTANYNEH